MTLFSKYIVYPEEDTREIDHPLSVNQIVDLNGFPLTPPLPTYKMIVFRVYKITTQELKGETIQYYHLELVRRDEMVEYL